MQQSERQEKKTYTCQECGRQFTHPGSLKTHMITHIGDSNLQCNICGRQCVRMSHLENHMRIHTGEKPFICNECNKTFSLLGSLKTHMTTHTGLKLLSCNLCSKQFNRPSNLDAHMRMHSGEKPYICTECGKRFPHFGSLKIHMEKHVMSISDFKLETKHSIENEEEEDLHDLLETEASIFRKFSSAKRKKKKSQDDNDPDFNICEEANSKNNYNIGNMDPSENVLDNVTSSAENELWFSDLIFKKEKDDDTGYTLEDEQGRSLVLS